MNFNKPYPRPTGHTTATWLLIEPVELKISDLTFTQDGVYLHSLLGEPRQDPVFVVEWQGRYYLEDGHTRVARAILTGQTHIMCRIFRENKVGPCVCGCGRLLPRGWDGYHGWDGTPAEKAQTPLEN